MASTRGFRFTHTMYPASTRHSSPCLDPEPNPDQGRSFFEVSAKEEEEKNRSNSKPFHASLLLCFSVSFEKRVTMKRQIHVIQKYFGFSHPAPRLSAGHTRCYGVPMRRMRVASLCRFLKKATRHQTLQQGRRRRLGEI